MQQRLTKYSLNMKHMENDDGGGRMNETYNAYRELRIIKNRERRKKIVRNQKIALALIISVVIFTILFVYAALVSNADAGNISYKYYTGIEVHSEDSLCNIARRFITEEYEDTDQYIKEVRSINHIRDDEDIIAGQTLIIPYYSSVFK